MDPRIEMTPIRQTQKKYCSRAMAIAIVAGLILILAGLKPIAKGLIMGTIFSVINFVLMGETLPTRMGKSKRRNFVFSLGSIFARYVLMAVPLFVAIKFEEFNLFAVIFGIFSIQLVILSDHLFALMFATRRKQV